MVGFKIIGILLFTFPVWSDGVLKHAERPGEARDKIVMRPQAVSSAKRLQKLKDRTVQLGRDMLDFNTQVLQARTDGKLIHHTPDLLYALFGPFCSVMTDIQDVSPQFEKLEALQKTNPRAFEREFKKFEEAFALYLQFNEIQFMHAKEVFPMVINRPNGPKGKPISDEELLQSATQNLLGALAPEVRRHWAPSQAIPVLFPDPKQAKAAQELQSTFEDVFPSKLKDGTLVVSPILDLPPERVAKLNAWLLGFSKNQMQKYTTKFPTPPAKK